MKMIPPNMKAFSSKDLSADNLKRKLKSSPVSGMLKLLKKHSSDRCCITYKDYVDDESTIVEVGQQEVAKAPTAIELQQIFSSKIDGITDKDPIDGAASLTSDLTDENLSDNLGEKWLVEDDAWLLNYSFSGTA